MYMPETGNDSEVEKQHSGDIFRVGDVVPMFGELQPITARETAEDIPDDIPGWMHPNDYTDVERDDVAKYVVLTIDLPDGRDDDDMRALASWLSRDLSECFDEHGLPSVRADIDGGVAGTGKTGVQTPATGKNLLERDEASALADFLRLHRNFEPLRALLGGVESAEAMVAVADALDRATKVREYTERAE